MVHLQCSTPRSRLIKSVQNQMEICIGLGVGTVKTFLHINIEPNSLCLGLGQCKDTIMYKLDYILPFDPVSAVVQ